LFFFDHAFLYQDPDRNNKLDVGGTPVFGCSLSNPVVDNMNGFSERAIRFINGFRECAAASKDPAVTRFTPLDFANKTFRGLACHAGPGVCGAAFCDELAANLTAVKGSFCGTFDQYIAFEKRCAADYRLNGRTGGDLSCSNILMTTSANPGTNLNEIDVANFLGCGKARDDFTIVVKGASQKSYMYRTETAFQLLSAAPGSASLSGLVVVIIALAYLLI